MLSENENDSSDSRQRDFDGSMDRKSIGWSMQWDIHLLSDGSNLVFTIQTRCNKLGIVWPAVSANDVHLG